MNNESKSLGEERWFAHHCCACNERDVDHALARQKISNATDLLLSDKPAVLQSDAYRAAERYLVAVFDDAAKTKSERLPTWDKP